MRILYIEDDKIDQLACKRLLGKLPEVACTIVSYIKEGLTLMEEKSFDLIISDHHLSDGTASDILCAAGGVPVIVTSGTQYPEDVEDLLAKGAIGHLLKPISFIQIQEMLENIPAKGPEMLPTSFSKPVLDLSYLQELSSGDASFEREMLEIFVAEVPQSLKELQACLDNKKWQESSEVIHRLGSKIRIMGLHLLREQASQLEAYFKHQENLPFACQQVRRFIQTLEESVSHTQTLIIDRYAHNLPDS